MCQTPPDSTITYSPPLHHPLQNREAMTAYARTEQVNVLDATGLDASSSGEEPLSSREGGHSDVE